MANDDIMIRIANALEKVEAIQQNSHQQTEQYQKFRQDLMGAIDKGFQKQKPPENTVDAKQLASLLLPHLLQGFDDKKIRVAGQEIVNQIREERQRIPNSIAVKGELWGFTSWKPLFAYATILILSVGLCVSFWYQKQETVQYQQARELLRERNYLDGQIDNFWMKYPKFAKDLFPPYPDGGFWKQHDKALTTPTNK